MFFYLLKGGGGLLHFSFTVFTLFNNLILLIPSKRLGVGEVGDLREGGECLEGLPLASLYGSWQEWVVVMTSVVYLIFCLLLIFFLSFLNCVYSLFSKLFC